MDVSNQPGGGGSVPDPCRGGPDLPGGQVSVNEHEGAPLCSRCLQYGDVRFYAFYIANRPLCANCAQIKADIMEQQEEYGCDPECDCREK